MIVLVSMSSRLEQVQEKKGRSLTVEEVQEVVRLGATQFPRDRLTKLPDLKFKYVERTGRRTSSSPTSGHWPRRNCIGIHNISRCSHHNISPLPVLHVYQLSTYHRILKSVYL